jgi:thioredoxin reductase (NADPH)
MAEKYDIIILGGGPAGLTAGLYGSRAGLGTLVVESGTPGGQVLLTERIENYPGFPDGITGQSLTNEFMKQAKKWGCEVKSNTGGSTILSIGNGSFIVETKESSFRGSSAIIATGCEPSRLKVSGEEKFLNSGVSYCAVCDGSFFEDLDVVVVGGGDAALEEALYLAKLCRNVYIVHRRARFRGTECLQKIVCSHPKITLLMNSVVDAFEGSDILELVRLRNVATNECSMLAVNGAFIYVGQKPRSTNLPREVACDENGYIITNENMETSVPGIFAAGDVRKKMIRQIATAVGDGAVAALNAEKYIVLSQCRMR